MSLLQAYESVNMDFISTLVNPEDQLLKSFNTILFFTATDKYRFLKYRTHIPQGVSTQVKEEIFKDNNSSFEECSYEDFDVNSKFIYKKSYKLQVKVKSITKFSPHIILD